MQQSWVFLKSFITSPKAVGSVVPSSRYLVNVIVSGIDWSSLGSIAELGAGTGVVTKAIDRQRSPDSEFLVFECDAYMRAALERRYDSVAVHDDAFDLRKVMESRGLSGLDCIVSGVPFVNFSQEDRTFLLQEIHDLLNPGGIFVALQFSRNIRSYLKSMYAEMNTTHVWANVPPAYVYHCRRDS
ncbi:class I SAM-dependent methyltransferase [Fodinicurvata sediminis]|uniref:class I SAM-dependent methyltransferase n=1 Tax=Fodinicurvata sediminis TaxID=1121832 RepID=UPI0003B5126E|nr:methyltransferase [Fodinicurvata sediminis]